MVKPIARPLGTSFCAILIAAVSLGVNLPTVPSLQDRLTAEIQRMIDAGHLAPGLCTFEQHYSGDHERHGWQLDDYWHNPADTVVALAMAIPHLPVEMQPAARTYLQSEFALYPPYQYMHIGSQGARREDYGIPPEYSANWQSIYNQFADPQDHWTNWPTWVRNPYNIYACFKYAEVFPAEASHLLEAVRTHVEAVPYDEAYLEVRPHILNLYIAGYYGFLGLQNLVGEAASTQVQGWLQSALAIRLRILDYDEKALPGAEAGGFMWLVPELGDYLYQNARARVQQIADYQQWATPYWFIAKAQEVTRFDAQRGFMEGYHAHIYDYQSGFAVRAYALKWNRTQLEKYLDARGVARGDLYFIQNLVATLAAGAGAEQVATPIVAPGGGNYSQPIAVTLTTATSAAAIHYTLDGTEPDEADPSYAQAISISATTTLKARAYKTPLLPSGVAAAYYVFGQPPTDAGAADATGSDNVRVDGGLPRDGGADARRDAAAVADGQSSSDRRQSDSSADQGDGGGQVQVHPEGCACRTARQVDPAGPLPIIAGAVWLVKRRH